MSISARSLNRATMVAVTLAALLIGGASARAAELRVLATGATKSLITSLAADFKTKTGHVVILQTDTAGGVAKRIEGGEGFDVAIATKGVIDALIAKGKLAPGTASDIASTSIGVAVKDGAAKPDISTVDAFKRTMLAAATIAYVDPASGGTSGIYIAGVLDRLGLSEALKPKLRLKAGGYVAELVANGEAEIAIHQISEILPVKGVVLIGELPKEIQSVTTYTAGLPKDASAAAEAFRSYVTGPDARVTIEKTGMKAP